MHQERRRFESRLENPTGANLFRLNLPRKGRAWSAGLILARRTATCVTSPARGHDRGLAAASADAGTIGAIGVKMKENGAVERGAIPRHHKELAEGAGEMHPLIRNRFLERFPHLLGRLRHQPALPVLEVRPAPTFLVARRLGRL